jgi:F-type H+-transporting ATPase subunit b
VELSWSSFILEIINFLVLVWILKRLFYAPIHNIIMQRKQAIQTNVDKAQNLRDEATKLEEKYDNRLQAWEVEKAEKRKAFQQELDEWKSSESTKFEKHLEEEKNKMYSREKQKINELIDKNTSESFTLAGKFTAKLLTSFADFDLENKIIEEVLTEFARFTKDKKISLKNNCRQQVDITSAYTLNESKRKNLIESIHDMLGQDVKVNFSQNADLLAGVTIKIGSVLLEANLRDELKFFTDVQHE